MIKCVLYVDYINTFYNNNSKNIFYKACHLICHPYAYVSYCILEKPGVYKL